MYRLVKIFGQGGCSHPRTSPPEPFFSDIPCWQLFECVRVVGRRVLLIVAKFSQRVVELHPYQADDTNGMLEAIFQRLLIGVV